MHSYSVIILFASVARADITPSPRHSLRNPLPQALAPRMRQSQSVPFVQVGPNPLRSRTRIYSEEEDDSERDSLQGIAKFFNPFGQDANGKYNEVGAFKEQEGAEYLTLYKLENGVCKESTLAKGIKATLARATEGLLLGFSEGNCASQGYSKAAGDDVRSFPLLGDVTVTNYQRSELYLDITIPVVFSMAFLAGIMLTLVMVGFRRSSSNVSEDPLLATYS